MLCPRSFRFESLKWVMEADSAELGKSACLENRNGAGKERNGAWLSFPCGGRGRICYYDAVRMDDEMPLKREDLRKRAEEKAAELAAEGMELRPITVSGRTLAKRFWGKEWMKSLSACEVYGMRLAPGRTYLRYGCVLDLKTVPGRIDALVMGEHLYEVCIQASPRMKRRLPGCAHDAPGRLVPGLIC